MGGWTRCPATLRWSLQAKEHCWSLDHRIFPFEKRFCFFQWGGTCNSVVLQKPYPCKAAYAAGSWDARVLPSCFLQMDLWRWGPGCDMNVEAPGWKPICSKRSESRLQEHWPSGNGSSRGLFNLSGFLFFIFDFPGVHCMVIYTAQSRDSTCLKGGSARLHVVSLKSKAGACVAGNA